MRRTVFLLAAVAHSQSLENLHSVLWTQTSAEYQAIALQTFQAAHRSLRTALGDKHWTAALEQAADFTALPPAIILDLDETVLDNAAFRVWLVREGGPFTEERWQKWVDQKRATPLPGAVEFLKEAHAGGVAAFYISNRVCDPSDASDPTVAVLKTHQFPYQPERLLCRAKVSDPADKSHRRARVAASHRILLLLGDDLNDFSPTPPAGDVPSRLASRNRILAAHRNYWGTRWFMLPNAMYGSWERAIGDSLQTKLDILRP